MLDGLTLEPRQREPLGLRVLLLAAGLAAGLAAAAGILVADGVAPGALLDDLVLYVFLDPAGLAQTVTAATPLVLVGLAAAVSLRLRFWNVGIEGQVWLGTIGATWVAVADVGPPALRLVVMAVAAVAAGVAWIAVPAALRLSHGVSEVISTLLLSYIAFLLVQHLLFGAWRDPATSFPVSPPFDAAERLPPLGWGAVHAGLWIALAAGLVVWALMRVTRFGYYADAVGGSPQGAAAAGLPVTGAVAGAVALSGGLAGLAGFVLVAGQEYRLTQFVGQGYTFSAILIAFVARFDPLASVLVAFAVGGLYTAGDSLKVFYQLPGAIVVLLEATVLLGVVVADFFGRYRIALRRAGARAA